MYDVQDIVNSPSSQHSSKYSNASAGSSSPGASTISDFDITNLEADPSDIHSTTAVLHYCTRAILNPYHYFITVLGWRPITTMHEDGFTSKTINLVYLLFVVLLMVSGFVLQGILCFRRDGMDIAYQTKHLPTQVNDWNSSRLFLLLNEPFCDCKVGYFIFPNVLPFAAFVHTLYLFRFTEYEQLHTLMEKAFLQIHQSTNLFFTQPKLCRIVWLSFIGCILWLLITCVTQGLHLYLYIQNTQMLLTNCFNFSKDWRCPLLGLMLGTTLFHDLTSITVLWSYGIQCELLIYLVKNICERIRNKTRLQDAIKEIDECNKFIRYLNEEMSISVTLLVLYSAILTALQIINVTEQLKENNNGKNIYNTIFISFSIITWVIVFALPIVQAARLAANYSTIKAIGHHIRSRPFGYQNSRRDELDSFLLYTSSLNTKIKLFCIPVNVGFITFGFAVCVIYFCIHIFE